MRELIGFCGLCLVWLAGAAAQAAGVAVEMRYPGGQWLELTYQASADCGPVTPASLGLGQRSRYAAWQPLPVRHRSGLAISRFRVPLEALVQDRVYPPALPVGRSGVLAHLSHYLPRSGCPLDNLTLKPGPGQQAFVAGRWSRTTLQVSAARLGAGQGYVYLGTQTLLRMAGIDLLAGEQVQPSLVAAVTDDLQRQRAYYHQQLPDSVPPQVLVVLSQHPALEAGRQAFQGDVADSQVMRLSVLGDFPSAADGPLRRAVQRFVAHESAHLTQARLRVAGPGSEFIREGEAELLGWLSLQASGQMVPAELDSRIEHAINSCLLGSDQQTWRQLQSRAHGRLPYVCGVTAIFLSVLGRPADLAWQDRFWRQVSASRQTPLDSVDGYLGCPSAFPCTGLAVAAGELPFAQWVLGTLSALPIRLRIGPEPPEYLRNEYAQKLFAQVQMQDCAGRYSWINRERHVEVTDAAGCHQLRDGMAINELAGQRFLDQPLAALQAMQEACLQQDRLALSLDGRPVATLACAGLRLPEVSFVRWYR